ncbi:TetR family transcriptional regulator [Streptacidiphilus pinicola]|uniref:TetR family transcriptional regulator n=1 Tax=Streptacidiphilus pinicola TaxID=2219663 RepID=A0A2X0K8N0_9ACTN|nr:TetR family transcriptional regulator C-terminal domain-containing protein [Streptacidiphilus pinicola]RAG85645.1 TetR family transcriptional regulator [Streptacidiphilus pinicola]
MSSSAPAKQRVRKSPKARRAEIVGRAATLALTEGLECITMRRVAEDLAVRPGLISHYFPVAEELVAEAFGTAASEELEELIPAERPAGSALDQLARFFARATGARYDDMSRLWLNARHLSRFRPVLAERVAVQEAAWRDRITRLLREGTAEGAFRPADPAVAAIQILVVLDGLGVHANTDRSNRPPAVTNMAVVTAERELGLPEGSLLALVHDAVASGTANGAAASEPLANGAVPPAPTA